LAKFTGRNQLSVEARNSCFAWPARWAVNVGPFGSNLRRMTTLLAGSPTKALPRYSGPYAEPREMVTPAAEVLNPRSASSSGGKRPLPMPCSLSTHRDQYFLRTVRHGSGWEME